MNSSSRALGKASTRNVQVVIYIIAILISMGWQPNQAATYTPVAEWNGTQFHALNTTGGYILQDVDNPVIDVNFSGPTDIVAWTDGSSYYAYVVDAGNDRVQIFTTDIAYFKDATTGGNGTLVFNGGGASAGGDFDATTIMLNHGGVVRGSEELVVGTQTWDRVFDLGGYTYLDKKYTIVYEGATATGGVFTLPTNSLSSSAVLTVKYAYSATVATNLLGDIDYTVAVAAINGATIGDPIELNATIPSNASPVLTIDVLSGIAYNANVGAADEADIYVLDAGSAGPVNAALYAFHIEDDAAAVFSHQDSYDGPMDAPQDVAFAQSGTNTLAIPVVTNFLGGISNAPAIAPTVSILNNALVQNHDYTIEYVGPHTGPFDDLDEDGGVWQVTDNTLGNVIRIVPTGVTGAGSYNFDNLLPGMRWIFTSDAAQRFDPPGTGATVNITGGTAAVNNDYIFIADTGNDRIKIIKGADNGATATNGISTSYFEDDSDIRDDYGVVTAQIPNQRFVSSIRSMGADFSLFTYDNSEASTQAWTRVADVSASGSGAFEYEYNYDTQVISFGNGGGGAMPDVSDTIYAEYKPSLDVLDYGTTGTGIEQFTNPSGITARWNASRGWYDIYVSDTDNNRIVKLKFSPATKTVTWVTKWVTGIAGDLLSGPTDLVVMSDGQAAALDTVLLFVCDTGNDRVIVYRDEAAENEGTSSKSDSTFVTAFGGNGTNLGQFNSPSGISVVLNGTNFDVYVTDDSRGYATKFQTGDDPDIDVDYSNILTTAYPTSANYIFQKQNSNSYLTTNASSSMFLQFFYSDTTAADQATANLCSNDSFAVTIEQFSWNFADTPGSPALDDLYYVYARLFDQYGIMIKEDKSISLIHIDANATNGMGTIDSWDGDSYFYVQNGSTRFLDLSLIFPDSVVSASFAGDYPSAVIDTIIINRGNAWNALQK